MTILRLAVVGLLVATLGACSETPAGTGKPPTGTVINAPPIKEYRLAAGDKVSVTVNGAEDLSKTQMVRPDGRISVPLLPQDYRVAGMTVEEVKANLRKDYLARQVLNAEAADRITVTIDEFGQNYVYVAGEVTKPGKFPFTAGSTAVRAIAEAGSYTETAEPTSVLVYRQDGSYQVVNLKRALNTGNFGADIALRPMDLVYVPRSQIGDIDLFVKLYLRNILPIEPGLAIPVQ